MMLFTIHDYMERYHLPPRAVIEAMQLPVEHLYCPATRNQQYLLCCMAFTFPAVLAFARQNLSWHSWNTLFSIEDVVIDAIENVGDLTGEHAPDLAEATLSTFLNAAYRDFMASKYLNDDVFTLMYNITSLCNGIPLERAHERVHEVIRDLPNQDVTPELLSRSIQHVLK